MRVCRAWFNSRAIMIFLQGIVFASLSSCDAASTDSEEDRGGQAVHFPTEASVNGVSVDFGKSQLQPIKGLSLGMPIDEAVAIMNSEAGPIWAATLGKPEDKPFKVLRISGAEMDEIRLQLIQLVSAMTMQLYRVDPADRHDLFIVVPSNAAENASDLKAAGLSVLRSVLLTGFFAWADADARVRLFVIGPTISNAIFDASFMPMEEFALRFGNAYGIPSWEQIEEANAGIAYIYETDDGPSVALAEDLLRRRTVVVWDSSQEPTLGVPGQGDFN